MSQMGGYLNGFSLHNNTNYSLAEHLKEAITSYQEPLDIEITSAAIHELHPQQLHADIPELALTNNFGHYNLHATPAGIDALNQEPAVIEHVLAQITNQQHNNYQLPPLNNDLLADKPVLKELLTTYKTVTDAATQTYWFGRISANNYEHAVLQPRLQARKRFLDVLVATSKHHALREETRRQTSEYTHALAHNNQQETNALSALAKHTYHELSKLFEADISASKRLDYLVDLTTLHHITLDFANSYIHDEIQTRTHQEPVTFNQTYTDALLETIYAYNHPNGHN